MRKIGWIAAGMALAVMAGGCGESAGDPAAESSTLLPGFSSESELIGFLKERRTYYDVAVYSDAEPDLFAKPGYIPEGYVLDEIVLSRGNKSTDHFPFLQYSYLSEEFLEYRNSVTHFELVKPGASDEYQQLKRQNEYLFVRDTVVTESEQLTTQYIQTNSLEESELYPGVYYIRRWNGPGQTDYTDVVWFDDYSFICNLRMPYEMFEEENIPIYTELEYFYIDTNSETMVLAE